MKKVFILSLLLSVFLSGCGESIFEAGSNKETAAAKEDTLDFNFITGNCKPVISHFESIDGTGVKLNTNETVMFLSALLECGGFSVLNGVSAFGNLESGDMYSVAAAMAGIGNISTSALQGTTSYYKKASEVCTNKQALSKNSESGSENTYVDVNIATLCGFNGMIGTTLSLTELIAGVTGVETLTISKQGFQEALTGITDLNKSADKFFTNNLTYTTELTNILESVTTMPDSVSSILGDTTAMVDEYKSQLYDNTGKVSADKLKAFLSVMQSGTDFDNEDNENDI